MHRTPGWRQPWDPVEHTRVEYRTLEPRPWSARLPALQVYYVVDKASSKGWGGGVGYITTGMLKAHMPPPGPDSLVLVCGPPPMMKAISGDKAPDKVCGAGGPGRGRGGAGWGGGAGSRCVFLWGSSTCACCMRGEPAER